MNEWIKIERDKYGFATDEALDSIEILTPCWIWNSDTERPIIMRYYDDLLDWRGVIKRDTCYTHYMEIESPNPPKEETL